MEKNQFNDLEYNQFYFNLKDNFKSVIQHSLSSTNVQAYSEILSLKICLYFETIFGTRHNSSLYDYYNSLHFEIKDIEERNNKIILKAASDFIHSFSYFFDEISESRFVYFFKSSFIEKKLGFQKGDKKFNYFLATLILKDMRFENQDFSLIDITYGTIINAFAKESIKNIRSKINSNYIEIDSNDILNDINKLEIKKTEGKFEFLDDSIISLRLLKSDIDSFKENNKHTTINVNYETNVLVDSRQINHINNDNSKTENHSYFTEVNNSIDNRSIIIETNILEDNRQTNHINNDNSKTEKNFNLTEVNNFLDNKSIHIETNDNRHTDNHHTNNYQTDYHNIYNSHHIENNTDLKKDPINTGTEVTKKKIEIKFSPAKFRNLLIAFFEKKGVKIDTEKKYRIERFILNVIDFDTKKHSKFNGSPSETTINFFDKKNATILKFCALLLFIMKNNKMTKIGAEPLQKILTEELKEIHILEIGISTNLRNQIKDKLKELSKEELAKFAGFNNIEDLLSYINS